MALRYYRNGPARALAVPLANGTDTSITVDSAAGFPVQFPYTIIIDPNQSTEEVCDVTAAVGNVLTLARGADSTTAVAHGAGAVVWHGVSARDPREANAHVNATTNVHGGTGAIVDTDSVQSIPGAKTFDSLATTGGGAVVAVGGVQTVTGAKTFSALTTMNGGQTVAGAEIHAGTESHAGAETHTGTESHSNTETHSGAETHSGTIRLSNALMQAILTSSSTDETTSSSTFGPGGTPVGAAFTAPPSGKMFVTWSALLSQAIDGKAGICTVVVRAGSSVGSGSVVVAASSDRAITCGRAVNTGSPSIIQASRRTLMTGFTPGDPYNVQIEFATDAGGGLTVAFRELLLEPHL